MAVKCWWGKKKRRDCASRSAYDNIVRTLDKVTGVFLIIGTYVWPHRLHDPSLSSPLQTPETDVRFQRPCPPLSGNPSTDWTHPLSDAFTQAGVVTHWAGWLLGGWITWCNGSPCVRCSTFYWRPKGLGSEVRPPEAGSNSSSWIWKLTRFSQPSGPPYWERNKCACWEGAILV